MWVCHKLYLYSPMQLNTAMTLYQLTMLKCPSTVPSIWVRWYIHVLLATTKQVDIKPECVRRIDNGMALCCNVKVGQENVTHCCVFLNCYNQFIAMSFIRMTAWLDFQLQLTNVHSLLSTKNLKSTETVADLKTGQVD